MTLTVSGYRIDACIYDGETSAVYRGVRDADRAPVILKVAKEVHGRLSQGPLYEHAYALMKRLDGAGTGAVRAYELRRQGERMVLIMEDIGGISLEELLRAGPVDIRAGLRLAIACAGAVEAIHERDVIHKDIHPGNIVVVVPAGQGSTGPWQVSLIDFRLATSLSPVSPAVETSRSLSGALGYLSPEQTGRVNRVVDYRSDFYALGSTIYAILTGHPPFVSSDPLELIHCHIARRPRRPDEERRDLPPIVGDIVMKLLSKSADERYQSARGLRADLSRCLELLERPLSSGPEAAAEPISFALGQHDHRGVLQVPQRLYGRSRETRALLEAFDRVSQGGIELVVIAGYAGIGKTTLASEIHVQITERHGYFLTGKFSELQRDIPYYGFRHALRGFCTRLLSEPEPVLREMRARILAAVGVWGQMLFEIMPDLAKILGPQPPVPVLGEVERQTRLFLAACKLLRAMAHCEHPLVVFLDDLQWADASSLRLLGALLADVEDACLLFVGACRSQALEPGHPVAALLDELRQSATCRVSSLVLEPLPIQDISALIADTLRPAAGDVMPLAEQVAQKTGGNPFFLTEFLKAIHAAGMLVFDWDALAWRWDLAGIRAMGITDNVADLLSERLGRLPDSCQRVLGVAACLGASFALQSLAALCRCSSSEVAYLLWHAAKEGLVMPISPTGQSPFVHEFRFVHDRVQDAAYVFAERHGSAALHLQIGRLMLERADPGDSGTDLFAIVNHLNLGSRLITEVSERRQLAELNLAAGRRAKTSAAYEPALGYFRAGLELLGGSELASAYELSKALLAESARAAHLAGDLGQAMRLVEQGASLARGLMDEIGFHEIAIEAHIAHERPRDALAMSLVLLGRLGEELPGVDEEPDATAIHAAVAGILALLDGRSPATLVHLPPLPAERLPLMRILSSAAVPALIAKPALVPLIVCRQVALSMTHGNAPWSAYAYSLFAVSLCTRGEIVLGYAFGKLALDLVESLGEGALKARVVTVFNHNVRHWQEHVRACLEPLETAYAMALAHGDLEFAGWAAYDYCAYLYMSGRELGHVDQEMTRYRHALAEIKQDTAMLYIDMHHFAVTLLRTRPGPSAACLQIPDSLPGPDHPDKIAHSVAVLSRLRLAYLFAEEALARECAVLAERSVAAILRMLLGPVCMFYHALVCLRQAAAGSERERNLATVDAHQQRMQRWAGHAPMNFRHMYDLVEAERARVLGERWRAVELYREAIRGARAGGFVPEEALANECAGVFWLQEDHPILAAGHLEEAYRLYAQWGALAKLADMDRRYGAALQHADRGELPRAGGRRPTTAPPVLEANPAAFFDTLSLIKAAQTIAGEVTLDRLLATMIDIVLEYAGAQRGLLLLPRGDTWQIEVEGSVDGPPRVLLAIPVDLGPGPGPGLLPHALVQYIARTGDSVVIDDAARERDLIDTAYFTRWQPKSVLAMPLLYQGMQRGILYLENSLSTDAFTAPHLQVLGVLCSQMAISLEHARLYRELDERVQERTQALREVQGRLAQAAHRAGMAEVASNVLHTVGNAITSVMASLSVIRDLAARSPGQRLDKLHSFFRDANGRAAALVASPEGKLMAEYVGKLAEVQGEWQRGLASEIERLHDQAVRIETLLKAQSQYISRDTLTEDIVLAPAVAEVLALVAAEVEQYRIAVTVELAPQLAVKASRYKLGQVVYSLVSYAVYALGQVREPRHLVMAGQAVSAQRTDIRVLMPGVVLAEAATQEIFLQSSAAERMLGGHGFGLHYAAVAAAEMGGRVYAALSEDRGPGISLHLELPSSPGLS